MKRYTAFIETGRETGGDLPTYISVEAVRVIGINKKTGKLWVKSKYIQPFLVDASELLP